MHNSAPARGSEEWYAWVEQMLQKHDVDRERLWARLPQSPDNVGDSPNDPDATAPTTGT